MDLSRFPELFDGSKKRYGTFKPSGLKRADGKVEGRYDWETFPANGDESKMWSDHVNGIQSIGIVPIREDSTVSFGVIDVDQIKSEEEANEVLDKMRGWNLPLVPFRSKSGGVHAYLFIDGSAPAKEIKRRLTALSLKLGRPKNTIDIFPVQTKLNSDGTGNQINTPYFNHTDEETKRWAIRNYNIKDLIPLEEFLKMKITRVTLKELESIGIKKVSDYPPCMDYYFENKVHEGERDKALLQFGCVARKMHGNDEDKIREEMDNFVTKFFASEEGFDKNQFAKKVSQVMKTRDEADRKDENDIYYVRNNCRQIADLGRCDKVACRTRKFGLVEKSVMVTDYRMIMTNPRRHLLTMVNEQGDEVIISMTTDQLWTQNQIAKRCWEEQIKWTWIEPDEFQEMKDNWFKDMKVIDSYNEGEERLSEFSTILHSFIDEKKGANDITQIDYGYVYRCDKLKRYFWNATSFKHYAKSKYNKSYEVTLGEMLARMCEEEKVKHPDKKDTSKRIIQLHKGYQGYTKRCYSSVIMSEIEKRDNGQKINNFKQQMGDNEFSTNE